MSLTFSAELDTLLTSHQTTEETMKKNKRMCIECGKRPAGYFVAWTNHRGDKRTQYKANNKHDLCQQCWRASCNRERVKTDRKCP